MPGSAPPGRVTGSRGVVGGAEEAGTGSWDYLSDYNHSLRFPPGSDGIDLQTVHHGKHCHV